MKSSFSSWPQLENFEELAALAAVGELSALELERLRHHLAECSRCRDAYEAFANVASNDLGVAVSSARNLQEIFRAARRPSTGPGNTSAVRGRRNANAPNN